MEWVDYALADGGRLSLLANDAGVYAALDGEIIAGPIESQLVRVRVQLPLPNGRGTVGVRQAYDGAFAVDHDGTPLAPAGEKTPRLGGAMPRAVRTGMKALWVLAALNVGFGFLAYARPDLDLDAYVLWMVGAGFAGLASWVMTGPKQAAIPFALAIVFLVLDSLWMLRTGAVGGVVIRAFVMWWLYEGIKAARADNRARQAPAGA